jgi:hypothetical protein
VADAELAGLRRPDGNVRVLGELAPRVEREDEPAVELEHRDGAAGRGVVAGELGSDHTGRVEPEAVAVEREGPIEVAHRERDHVDARLHRSLPEGAGCPRRD